MPELATVHNVMQQCAWNPRRFTELILVIGASELEPQRLQLQVAAIRTGECIVNGEGASRRAKAC